MFFADAAAFESFIPLFVLYFLSFFLVVFPFSQFYTWCFLTVRMINFCIFFLLILPFNF